MTAVIAEMNNTARMSDSTLGDLLWDAWAATRNAHPARLAAARARLADLSAEARTRGFLVTTDHIAVGQSVTDTNGLTGTVTSIETGGGVIVQWPHERVPGLPATQRTHFLCTSLLVGALSAA